MSRDVGAATVVVHRDGCAVDAYAVAALLQTFVRDWNRERPPTEGKFEGRAARDRIDAVRPYDYLSEQTGIKPRTLERLAAARSRHVELRVADQIVAALGCPQVFQDGTLTIVPNPTALASVRAGCCGGSDSLTGVA